MHLSSEIAFNSWQQKWERDSSGFYTRFLLPQVRIPKSHFRMIVIPACPILQNVAQRYTAEWGQLQKRFKGISSVRLWWGTWNVSHFLLRCPHYDEIRNKLQNVLDDIWTAAKRKGHLQLSDNLLLAPAQTDCITKRMDRDIKFAFFFSSSAQPIEKFDSIISSP